MASATPLTSWPTSLLGTATTEPEPEPEPTSTGATEEISREASEAAGGLFGTERCGTEDLTPCGLINRGTGNQALAEWLSGQLGNLLLILAVLLVAFIVRRVLHRAIGRTVLGIEADVGRRRGKLDLFESSDPITRARKVQRAKAIGSILRAIVSVVVWTAAVFVILGTIGVNITGLVAGAGIVGIALGFGAQTLVQDFISGLFMIAEDQYGVGDVIDMGEATGVVEAVGLRTTRLRAVDGTVWHVRNGEVVRVGNMSQGWSRAVLDVDVAYGEDLTQVMETLKELGHDMRSDPDWGDKFLDEPEVWGVEALAADGITVRMIIKTVPLEQWVVAREMRRRIKYRFDTLGIEIPFPQRTVWMRTEGPGSDDDEPDATGSTPALEPGPGRPGGEEAKPPSAAAGNPRKRDTGAVPVVPAGGADIPPAPQSTRGEANVAAEDAPAPGSGEPFGGPGRPWPAERR